ncbi:hypothetical protein E2C01_003709 [Portunus trituberculatus]|uniref:Uncharacterized protein n=1 Tax=Portunus trituberculatus TaxID=210409 RepID=A0A5B7CPD3_PORTR|nr:hypothetical protein [Portunus trituberculatus]
MKGVPAMTVTLVVPRGDGGGREMLGGGNFSTLLTLAALQEGKGGHGVPLPPTLDPHKNITTPTTSTSEYSSGLTCYSRVPASLGRPH